MSVSHPQLNRLAAILTFLLSVAWCIPGQAQAQTIQAEAWTTMLGLQTQATTDAGGGLNVGWIDAGDWAEYLNQPFAAGQWTVEVRIATMATNRQVQILVDDVLKTTVTQAANTGGWQNWATAASGAFNIATGGNHKVRISFPGNNMNLNWIRFVPVAAPDATPPSVPGSLQSPSQGETTLSLTWSASTDNVAVTGYEIHVNGALRTTLGAVTSATVTGLAPATSYQVQVRAVDGAGNKSALTSALQVSTQPPSPQQPLTIQAEAWTTMLGLQTEATTDAGGGLNVGYIDANDWAEYINQPLAAGTWKVEARMATMATNRSIQVLVGGTLRTTVTLAASTGGWQTWNTATSGNFTLPTGGNQTVRLVFPVNQMNLNWVRFVPVVSDATPPSVPANLASPSRTETSVSLAWTASTDNIGVTGYEIHVDGALRTTVGAVTSAQVTGLAASTTYSFRILALDAAGNKSALSTALSAATSPSTGLTIQAEAWTTMLGLQTEATTDVGGGLNVAYIDANDWAEYANQPLAAGTYVLEARMATMATNRSVQLFVDGTLRTTATLAANTGGWQVWATATSGTFTVPTGGNHLIRVVFPVNQMNLNWIRLVPQAPDGQAPTVPAGLASPSQSANTIALTWTASTDNVGVTGYEIHVNGALHTTVGAVTSASLTGLQPLTAYAVRILAADGSGNKSALSAALNVSTNNQVNLNGVYALRNRNSGKCMEVSAGSLVNGGLIIQNACNGSPFQKWQLASLGGDNYTVKNVGSGLLMDVQGGGATDIVQQWGTADTGPSQRWRVLAGTGGIHTFNALSDLNECLDVAAASLANGAQIQTYVCNGSGAQKFELVPTTAASQCWAGDAPATPLATQEWWPSIAFSKPLEIVQEPAASGSAFFVMDQLGTVRRMLNNAADGVNRVFFSLAGRLRTSGESGLASMAFDPEYGISNRFLYITYVSSGSNELRLSRLTASSDGSTADLATEVVLFRFQQTADIHNAGALAFGPGPAAGATYLYMSAGDNGTNLTGDLNPVRATLMNDPHGKILRLSQADYRSNGQLPWNYSTGAVNSYIVAKGLRNPWRISFDGDELWISNVGFDKIEEVNKFNVKTEIGTDFGWPYCEGSICCAQGINCGLAGLPPMPGNLRAPFHEYPRSDGTSGESAVIGGFVYRGTALPSLFGKYIFADYADQVLYSLDPVTKARTQILANTGNIADIGIDRSGEIYLVDYGRGNIYRVVPGTGGSANMPPANLMDWGCFTSLNQGDPIPAAPVHPFNVAQKFWSDGADKERFVSVPAGARIDVTNPEDWVLPAGGVTIKNFFWNGSIFETRLFVRHTNETYAGYTYRWDGPASATLVPAQGGTKDLGGHVWNYPSRAQCITCHTRAVGGSIALETRQFNVGSQLADFAHAGLLSNPDPEPLPPYPNHLDANVALAERAQSYMHVNCANCHRGPAESEAGRATWDARYTVPLRDKRACNETPVESVSGNAAERIIKPGDNTLSTIWLRAHQRVNLFMPPLGSTVPDVEGVNMLRDWMNQLTACP